MLGDSSKFVPLMGDINGRPALLQLNLAANDAVNDSLPICNRISVSFEPDGPQGVENPDGPMFDQIELSLGKTLRQSKHFHVLTVTSAGRRTWVIYSQREWTLAELEPIFPPMIDRSRIRVASERDDSWSIWRNSPHLA